MSAAPDLTPAPYSDDPSGILVATFEQIHRDHMRDLPIINRALSVQAVDFILWEDMWVGVLLTPWFLNLMLLPAEGGDWPAVAEGEKIRLRFPSGEYPFTGGTEERIGPYLFCSLASPVSAFPTQEVAVSTAREVMELLFRPATQEEADPDHPASLSRRGFLRGRLGPEGDDTTR